MREGVLFQINGHPQAFFPHWLTSAIESGDRRHAFVAGTWCNTDWTGTPDWTDLDSPLTAEEIIFLKKVRLLVEAHWIAQRALARLADKTGRAAGGPNQSCLYTTLDGRHCVVGAMLSEETLSALGQRSMAADRIVDYLSDSDLWVARHKELLCTLQALHDNYENWRGKEFIELAHTECLLNNHLNNRLYGVNHE